MPRYPTPDHEGHWWAKLVHPTGEPAGEKGEWRSVDYEVVQVWDNNGEGDEAFAVSVPGVPVTQWISDFVWGPEIPQFNPKAVP